MSTFRLQDHARYQTLKELEAVKSIRKEGGNEEDWTVEGFGNCTKSPAAEVKPSVRFTDENSPPSGGRLSDRIKSSTDTSSGETEEYRDNRSNTEQSSRLQSEKERAR